MSVLFWMFITALAILIIIGMISEKISNIESEPKPERSQYDQQPIKDATHYDYTNKSQHQGHHPSYQDMYANPTKNAIEDSNNWDY